MTKPSGSTGQIPRDPDSDGDTIRDGREVSKELSDPTLFDYRPPVVKIYSANWGSNKGTIRNRYTVSFSAKDPSLVSSVALSQKGHIRFSLRILTNGVPITSKTSPPTGSEPRAITSAGRRSTSRRRTNTTIGNR